MSSRVSEKNLSESLKIVLVKRGSNIAKLAELMGVSSTTMYSKFKRGNFTVKDLDNIAKALNITYDISFTIPDSTEENS